jgi:hypothetical protein
MPKGHNVDLDAHILEVEKDGSSPPNEKLL